jgi:pimeloyl-ACP methyl ester carboxylesterase
MVAATYNGLYKSETGYRAIMRWYDGLVGEMAFEHDSLFVDTKYGRTHMIAAGDPDAPPMFLIPGVAGSAPLWRRQLEDLSRHHRVYALDMLGQPGRSEGRPLSYLNDDFVHWLVSIMDELNIEKGNVVGASVGGWVCLRAGIVAPDRVNKCVMLGPTGICRAKLPLKIWLTKVLGNSTSADVLENDLTAKSIAAKGKKGTFGTFDRQLARAMSLATKHFRVDRSVGIYNEATGRLDPIASVRILRRFFLAESADSLRKFAVPGLIILGEHETLYDPKKMRNKAGKLMPDVRVEIVAGAGHAAMYDRPEIANRTIDQFIRH